MACVRKWNTIFRQKENKQRDRRINSVMEVASLSPYLAPNNSECDKSSIIKLLPNKRGSANPSHSSCKSSSAFRLKEQKAFSEEEQLAKKLADDQKHTHEKVCGKIAANTYLLKTCSQIFNLKR